MSGGHVNPEFLKARDETSRRIREEFGEMVACRGRYYPDPGWEELIRKTLNAMRELDPGIRINKIVNKWGECNIFPEMNSMQRGESRDRISVLKINAREESRNICAWCGSREGVTTGPYAGSYVLTLCPVCQVKYLVRLGE